MRSLYLPLTYPSIFKQFISNPTCTEANMPRSLILVNSFVFPLDLPNREKMLQRRGAVIALLLTCGTLICGVHSATIYIPSGRDKDAWPELLKMNVDDAVSILNASGLVQNIYVQPPSFGPGPADIGKTSDVWIYTDGSTVYETPRRGVWHANRLIPGWPELSGMWYKSAIAKIKQDYLGVTVVYGPRGSVVRTADIKMDRVFVEISNDSTVFGVPSVG